MEKNTYKKDEELFGNYTFADDWIIVTDRNGDTISVLQDDLIEFYEEVDKESHVLVTYFGNNYWIPRNMHFPNES